MYEYNAHILRVIDGDTVEALIDLGFKVFHKMRLRLLDIDTPEKFGKERLYGEKCKIYAQKLLDNKDVIIRSEKETDDVKADSFGRYLVQLWVDDKNIVDIYNNLGINKRFTETFSYENVENLTID